MYFPFIYLFIIHIHALYRSNLFHYTGVTFFYFIFFTENLEAKLHSWNEEWLSII